ncbi:tol-pal system protein YbgF [Candidatus Nitrospira bockiana]
MALYIGMGIVALLPAGCAKHADYLDLREEVAVLSKKQDAFQRRFQALEGGAAIGHDASRTTESLAQRVNELSARMSELERRLARLEDGGASGMSKLDEGSVSAKTMRPVEPPEAPSPSSPAPLPGTPGISPTSAFNLAYNDYLNGRYDLAVTGFQRFLKDFPSTSLAPNAHYWIGESYLSLKEYGKAMQAFQKVVSDYPRSEKVPPALFKLGVVAAESGDLPKARSYLKRVIEEYSTSDEAKLAKNKLAEIR